MAQPQRKVRPERSPRGIPRKYKFASNDPIYRTAKKLFKLYPWLKALYKLSELMDLIRNYEHAPYLISGADTNGFTLGSSSPCFAGFDGFSVYNGRYAGIWDFFNSICLDGQGAPQFTNSAAPVPSNATGLVLFENYGPWRLTQHWYRNAGDYAEKPFGYGSQIQQLVEAAPLLVPELYPFSQVNPVKVPYKLLPLVRSPFIERSYHVNENQNHQSSNSVRDIAAVEPVVTTNAQGNAVVSVRPATHRPQPPRDGVTEVKVKTSAAAKALAVASAVTETADFVQALWEALPSRYRDTGYSGKMQDKMLDLYNHASHIDIAKAIKNVAENQIEDYAYGWLPSHVSEKINQQIYKNDKYVSRGVLTGHSRRQSYLY